MNINFLFALGSVTALFLAFLLSAILGRYIGILKRKHTKDRKIEVLSVAEGTVFALLGLLVAFTFTGAYDRFEKRKMHIIEEANAIDTVYSNVDLLAKDSQAKLRQDIRQYLAMRVALSKKLTAFSTEIDLTPEWQLRKLIWKQAIAATQLTDNPAVTQIVLPSITNMFELATLRESIALIHPPIIIFSWLILLAMLSAFLAGYSSAEYKAFNSIYILSYVIIMSFTIYVIIDLEMPRVGLIRVDGFDHVLIDLSKRML